MSATCRAAHELLSCATCDMSGEHVPPRLSVASGSAVVMPPDWQANKRPGCRAHQPGSRLRPMPCCLPGDQCFNKVRDVVFDGKPKGPVFSKEYGPGRTIFKVGGSCLPMPASWHVC